MPLIGSEGAAHDEADMSPNAKRNAYSKEFKAKRAEEKRVLLDYLTKQTNLPADIKAIVDSWTKPRTGGGAFGEPLFQKIFGQTPKVGDTVTLTDVINRTGGKGVDKMNELMKKWEAKGTAVVRFEFNSAPNMALQSKYTIKSI